MKILVPTDFSDCADFALNAACQLALRCDGELCLFHAASMPEEFSGRSDEKDLMLQLKEKIESNINELMEQRKAMALSVGVSLESRYRFGKLIELLDQLVKEDNMDLVVMGSYGASGKQEWFIGSNTQKVVRKLKRNVLVIKNPVADLRFDKVMFPSNLTENDKEAFIEFLEFLKPFKTKEVHILAVNTSGWFNQPAPLMMELLDDFKAIASQHFTCHTHFYSDYSVEAGIRHFSEKFDIKLIGISNMVRHPIKRLFQGSNVEMLVNHSEVPVLAIDNRQ